MIVINDYINVLYIEKIYLYYYILQKEVFKQFFYGCSRKRTLDFALDVLFTLMNLRCYYIYKKKKCGLEGDEK